MSTVATMRAPTYNISHLMNAVRSEMTEGSEKGDPSERDLKVTLNESDLWRKFNKLTNEMIVTKTGRRMFPVLTVSMSGLNPNSMYSVLLDFSPADESRWKYVNGEWVPGGKPDSPPPSTAYIHPDSPNFGAHWMKQSVGFSKVKLSNKLNGTGQIMLNSLHRYEPRIHIIRVGGPDKQRLIGSFSFPETQFIAVTAYQNEDITQLKIKYNPFAKAFLDIKENRGDHVDLLEDSHDQHRYPQLGGWFLPSTGTLCGGANAHQFASSLGLPPAASHGCERYSSIRSHRTTPYPPPPYQKYSTAGTGYPTESSNPLSLIPSQDTWSSLAAASSTMSPHVTSSCAQYGSVWPATVSSASYSSHVVSSSSSPHPTSLVRADATNSPSPPSGSPYHHQPSPATTTSSATTIANGGSCTIYADSQYHDMLSTQDSSAFTSQMGSTHSTNPAYNHHHSSSKMVSSPWSPLTPPSV